MVYTRSASATESPRAERYSGLPARVLTTFTVMTEKTSEFASYAQTVNKFCAELAGTPPAEPFSLYRLRRRIEKHSETHGGPDRVLVALAVACRYGTIGVDEPNGAMAVGGWVPSFTHFEYDSMLVCPPPLDRVDDMLPCIWEDLVAEDGLHPLVRARLADLLSVLGHGDRFEFARIAVCGYLAAVADVATEDLERMVALKRIAYLCSGLDNACLLRIVRDTDSQTRAHPRPEGDDSQVPAAF